MLDLSDPQTRSAIPENAQPVAVLPIEFGTLMCARGQESEIVTKDRTKRAKISELEKIEFRAI